MDNEIVIFVLLLGAIFLFILGIYLYARSAREKKEFKERLGRIGEIAPDEAVSEQKEDSGKRRFLYLIGSLGKFLHPKKAESISEIRRMFFKAGYRKEGAAPLFFGLKVFLALLLFAGATMAKVVFWPDVPSSRFTYILFTSIFAGFYLPNLWIKLRIARRKEQIQHGIPDALDLMVVCVEAGVGLDAAINKVSDEIKTAHPELADELRLVNLEIRAGKQRQEALKNLVWRTDSDDLSSLVTLLIQTEKFGTSVAQALRVHSDGMRTRRYQRAEEIAQKLPIKLIFPLALFILPMFLLIVLGPAVFIFQKYLGN
jgi:tight adherence protein C